MKALYPALAVLVAVAAMAVTWHHVSPANQAAGCHTVAEGAMGGPSARPAVASQDDRAAATAGASAPSARPAVAPQDDKPAASPAQPLSRTVPAHYRGQIIRKRVRHFPRKLLALTFDDGPSPTITPRVLKTLRAHNAHATFFVLGRSVKRWPELVQQAAREGHAIGSHSYNHPSSVSAAEACSQLERTAALIEQATGEKPRLFRPPYGITQGNLCRTALQEGYTAVLWTISSADSNPIGAATIAHNVIHTPNPGDIVLMHDGETHAATAAALPQILTELSAAGFRFVTLPELLQAWEEWRREQGEKAHAQG